MKDGNDTFICCKYVLEEHLWRVSRLRQSNHSGRKKIGVIQLVGIEKIVRPDGVGNFVG